MLELNLFEYMIALVIVVSLIGNFWLGRNLKNSRKQQKVLLEELKRTKDLVHEDRKTAMDTGQTLACLCVQLNVARRFKARDPGQASLALERARELAGLSLERVRELEVRTR